MNKHDAQFLAAKAKEFKAAAARGGSADDLARPVVEAMSEGSGSMERNLINLSAAVTRKS